MRWMALLVMSAAFLVLGAACEDAGEDGEPTAPGIVTVDPATSTPQEDEVGFDEADVDYLVEALEDGAADYGWVAGCIWRENAAEESTLAPVSLLGLEGDRFASGFYGYADTAGTILIGTVYQPDYGGPTVTEFAKTEGDGYLCYEPR